MFLSEILINPCMIIHLTANNFFLSLLLTRFSTAELLKCHVDNCFKINVKHMN